MGAPRGFEALANLDQLGNDELNSLVLSNWLKLNRALKAGQPLPVLRRLLCLELERGPSVRLVIAERLRAAVSRALAREHEQACCAFHVPCCGANGSWLPCESGPGL